jgi:hypothetical protein
MNHIATGRALIPGGELLPPHHRRQQGWWRWRWGRWRRRRQRWRPMEMAPGALPHPGRVPEQRLLSPKIRRRWRWSYGTLSRKLPTPLGFSVPRLYIGEGALSGVESGGLTPRRRGQGLGHAGLVWGPLVAPLLLLFGSQEAPWNIWTSGFCFVQFREYFLCNFSETQK